MKKALITGITGQDGSYLAEYLIEQGYTVAGVIRRSSTPSTCRIAHLLEEIQLVSGDVSDQAFVQRIVAEYQPDEIYNLAAQSFVPASWDAPHACFNANITGPLNFLEQLRSAKRPIRFYQASSSEMYGKVQAVPQSEATPFYPRSPYGITKLAGHWTTVNYRESFGIYACSGILFNHESPRRGLEFVTKKIARSVARIKVGLDRELRLGNLAARRDWGYAPDYVRAMASILQLDNPQDFVVATGETHSVEEFVEIAFATVNLDWHDYVIVDRSLLRPAEVDLLVGDPTKAKEILRWKPTVTFASLVEIMVEEELKDLRQSLLA